RYAERSAAAEGNHVSRVPSLEVSLVNARGGGGGRLSTECPDAGCDAQSGEPDMTGARATTRKTASAHPAPVESPPAATTAPLAAGASCSQVEGVLCRNTWEY